MSMYGVPSEDIVNKAVIKTQMREDPKEQGEEVCHERLAMHGKMKACDAWIFAGARCTTKSDTLFSLANFSLRSRIRAAPPSTFMRAQRVAPNYFAIHVAANTDTPPF